jgi:hypothetical protein
MTQLIHGVKCMHFTVSWDIETSDTEVYKKVSLLMVDTVKRHCEILTEPISKYIVVKVENEAKWHIILKALTGICEMYKGKINFIMSPPMTGGQFNGRIKDWTRVNEAAK